MSPLPAWHRLLNRNTTTRKPKPVRRRPRLKVEILEERVVPSLSATLLDLGGGSSELRISGPAGSSINIDGPWQDGSDANHSHVYTASGDLTLKSAQGDISLIQNLANPLTVTTQLGSAQLASLDWTGPALSTDLSALAGFHNTFGVTLSTPATHWDVKQGADLIATGVPVNPDQPYISFGVDSGYTAQFGNASASGPLAVVFDPNDPLLYFNGGSLGFGGSFGGNLTLAPASGQPGFVDPVSGHLYGVGNVNLGVGNLTLQNAAMVVNLDAQHDGALLGSLSGNTASQLFSGDVSLTDLGGANLADVGAGFNGQTTLTYSVLGFDLPLTVQSASGQYAAGQVTVHGVEGISLLGATPLSFIQGDNVDVAATFDAGGLHGVQLGIANASLGGVAVGSATVSLSGDGVAVSGGLDGLLGGGHVNLSGSVTSNGGWSVSGSAGDLTAGPVLLHNATVTVDPNGVSLAASADVPLLGSVSLAGTYVDDNNYSFTAHLDSATIGGFTLSNDDVTLTNAGFSFQGDATLPLLGTVHVAGSIQNSNNYSLTAHLDSATIGGFTLSNDDLALSNAGASFAGDATLPLLNTVHLAGSIQSDGTYSLAAHLDSVTIGGFTLSNDDVTLSDTGLSFAGDATLPLLGTVHVAGSIQNSNNYTLTAHLDSATIGGFTLSNDDVTLTNAGVSFVGDASLPLLNTVHLAGSIQSDGTYSLAAHLDSVTIGGLTLSNDDVTLSSAGLTFAGDAALPLLGTVHVAGSIQDANNYSVTAHLDSVTIGGFTLSNDDVTLSNAGVTFAGDAALPLLGTVHLAGSVQSDGTYSLTAHIPSVTIAGFGFSEADVTLTNARTAGLNFAGDTTLPVVGLVHLAGSITDATNYSLAVHVTSVTVGAFSLSNVDVTLANAGSGVTISFAGDATLPLLNTVHVSGSITDATHYSFTAHIASATIGGFTLTNDDVTLSNTGLSFAGDASLPVVGSVHLAGAITDATHYSLAAHVASVTVGPLSLSNVDMTLANAGSGVAISFAGDATVALVGAVHLTGTITDATHYSFTAHVASVTIAGFGFSNADVTYSNTGLSFAADAAFPLLGSAHVSGSITDATHYSLTAHINRVTVAGFSLANDDVTLSNAGSGARLAFAGDASLPVVGSVHLAGTITDATHYSFTAHVSTVTVGPLSLSNVDVTLANAGSGVAISFAGDATVALVGAVHLTGTITDATHYSLTAHVASVTIAGFALTNGDVTYSNTGLSFAADAAFPLLGSAHVSGSITDATHYSLTAHIASVTIAGFGLSNDDVTLSNAGSGARLAFAGDATLPVVGSVHLAGSITDATHYSLAVHVTSVTVGPLSLSNVDVTLANAGSGVAISFAGDATVALVGAVHLTGTITDATHYSFTAHVASVTIAGFGFSNADVTYSNAGSGASLTFAGDAALPLLGTVHLAGSITDATHYSLTAHINSVTVAGFSLTNDDVTLSNAGSGARLAFAGDASLPVVGSVHLAGTITDATHYSLAVHVTSVTVGPLSLSNVDVTVANAGSGATVSFAGDATVALVGAVHLTGTITDATHYSFTAHVASVTVAGFGFSNVDVTYGNAGTGARLTFAGDAALPLLGTVHLAGSVQSDGTYSLTAHIPSVTIAGFGFSNADVTLTNARTAGLNFAGDTTLPVVGLVHLAGSITDTTHYSLAVHVTSVTVGAFSLSNVDVTLANAGSGVTVSFAGDATVALVGAVHLTGTITDATHYSLTAHITSLTIAGFGFTNADVTYSNTGLAFAGDAALPLLGTVHLAGSITDATHYSVTAHINSVTIAGFGLSNDDVTLSNAGSGARLAFAGDATLPVVGSVHLAGSITDATHYSLAVHVTSVTVGPLSLSNVDVTLANAGSGATVSFAGDATVALVGAVHLTGTITDATHYSLTAHIASLTIAGFGFTNADVTYSNTGLAFAGDAALPLLGTVHLAGSITDATHYSVTAHINSVTIAGFGLSNDDVTLSNAGSGARLTFAGNATLPVVGSVHLAGAITDATHYSLAVHVTSVTVGPLSLSNVDVTVANAGSGASVSFSGDATVALVGAVHLTGTITDATHYSLSAHIASLTIAGFGFSNADVTYSNTGLSFAGDVTFPLLSAVHVSGSITDATHYSLTAHINSVTIAGFGLTNDDVTLSNAGSGARLSFAGNATLPVVGAVHLAGAITDAAHYSFTVHVTSVSVGPLSLSNVDVTVANAGTGASVSFAGDATVALVGSVHLTGTITDSTHYSLSAHIASLTIAGFGIQNADVTYSNTGLSFAGDATLPLLNTVHVSGSITDATHYSFTAHIASATIAGFGLTNDDVTVSNSGLSFQGTATLPLVGSVHISGSITDASHYSFSVDIPSLTIGGFGLSSVHFTWGNTGFSLAGDVTLPLVNRVHVSGSITDASHYSFSVDIPSLTIGGFGLSNVHFTWANTGFSLAADVTLPLVNTVHVSGSITDASHYSFSVDIPSLTIGGFGLSAVHFTWANTGFTLAADVTLPLANRVHVSGSITDSSHYSFTVDVPSLTVGGFGLSNVHFTWGNTGFSLAADVTLPLVNRVHVSGSITDASHFSFSVSVPSLTILGFTLTNDTVTLSNTGVSVASDATLPLVGSVHFVGQISSATGFSLSATKTNVTVIPGVVTFPTVTLTLNQSSLTLSATVPNVPVVGTVTFAGAINFSGSFTISATATHFTILSFLSFDNASVSFSFPNPTLTVSAHVSLAGMANADFTGSISAGGHFSFDGHADLTVAGFTLGRASMHVGNNPGDPSDGIHIGPFTTPPLPVIGPVTLDGSYGPRPGQFSFDVDVRPTPPIQLGPIPLDRIHVGLAADGLGHGSLTLGAGVGYNIAGVVAIEGYAQITVSTTGDFRLLATVDATVLGFSAAHGQFVFSKTGSVYQMTLDININVIIVTAMFHGDIDFTHGKFTFTATANIGLAGFTLASTSFVATNVPDPVHYPGVDARIELHAHANLNLRPIISANVDFDGKLLKSGNSYTVDVHGRTNLTIAGFTLASATLDLDNSHMAVSVHYAYPGGLFTADFAGSVTWQGAFDLRARATIAPAGFRLANADLHLTNSRLDVAVDASIPLAASAHFAGTISSSGFSISADADIHPAGFTLARAHLVFSNTQLDVSANFSLLGVTAGFHGYIRSTGAWGLDAYADIAPAGIRLASAHLLFSSTQIDVSASLSILGINAGFSGYYRSNGTWGLDAYADIRPAGITLARAHLMFSPTQINISASLSFFGISAGFGGYYRSNGTWGLDAYADIRPAGITLARAHLVFSSSQIDISASLSFFGVSAGFSGYYRSNGAWGLEAYAAIRPAGFNVGSAHLVFSSTQINISASFNLANIAGVNLNGYYNSGGGWGLSFNGHFSVLGFGINGSVTMNSGGVAVGATMDVGILGIRASVHGSVYSNGQFSLTASAGINLGILGGSISFTLNNGGFSAHLNAHVGAVAHVGWWIFSGDVGAQVSVDVGFSIRSDGYFSASGRFDAQLSLLLSLHVGLGFDMDNHHLSVHMSDIGFSIWGVGFHPFGNITIHY